jgi:hypothetical protein
MTNNFNSNKGERSKMEEMLNKHIISTIEERLKNSMEFTKIWDHATEQEKIQLMKNEENEVVSQVYQIYKDFLERHNTENHQKTYGMIAVFAENKNRGVIYFDKLLDTLPYSSVKKVVQNPSEYRIELKNGYVYRLFIYSPYMARGYRWVKAIVDCNLISNADLISDVKYGFLTDYDIEYFLLQ